MRKFKNEILSVAAIFVAAFLMQTNVQAYTGVDISEHNGYINFDQLNNSDCHAVIIKATEGVDFVDSALDRYTNGVDNSNIEHIGYYHFMSERTNPTQQAIDFYNAIKDRYYDIMPCLDIEVNNYNRCSMEITNRCLEFITKFKELSGQNVMIYSGAFFARDNLDMRIKTQPLWVASYGRSPISTGFVNTVGWQYTETGHIGGINGYVDLNDFNDNMLLSNANVVPSIPSTPTDYMSYGNNVTQGKIAELQRICNIEDDNLYGPITDSAIKELPLAGLPYHTPNLTTWIQLRLGLEADGIYGYKTYNAVREWQANNGLKVDGVAGYNTIKSLALA